MPINIFPDSNPPIPADGQNPPPSEQVPPVFTPPAPNAPKPASLNSPTILPPAKKKFPALLFILPLVVIVLIAAIFLAKRFFPKIGVGQTNLTWWGLWEDETVVGPLIEEYQKQNSKVKIKYVNQSKADYRERLVNSLAKGEGPDIFRFHNSWVPMLKNQLDYVPASVISASDFAQSFYPVFSYDLTSGTGLVGLPLEYDGLGLYINEDIFNAEGKTPPTTWYEFRQLAKDLTRKDEQGIITQAGASLGRTENVDHWPEILALMMLQNKVNLAKPDECFPSATGGSICPGEDALTFFSVFSYADGVWDATLPNSTLMFGAGKLAMYFGPSWRVFEIKQKNPTLKFRIISVPQLPKSSPDEANVTYASYWVEGVWSRSKNKLAAWDFLKFLSSKESLEKMYQNAAKIRSFGEPYPRVEMAGLLKDDPWLGGILAQAPQAQSWYLQSRTSDGPTGINSQINKYYEDAINAVSSGKSAKDALRTVTQGVGQVLSQYGVANH